MIKIITVGNIKEGYLRDAIEEYLKRLHKYTNVEMIEVKDENTDEIEKNLKIEENRILKHINKEDYVITLEIDGKQLTSLDFAKKIEELSIETSHITFIIGGSYGLSRKIKERSNYALSFSKMTFPHQLFRVILLEQIYRAYKINHNENYHK